LLKIKEAGCMERYGYIRVSTKEQNPERQMIAMHEQNIIEKNIYLDKISGQNFDRPQYCKMLKKLKKGDVVVVKSIDRLGRNYGEILEQWRKITKDIGADIQVLDMPLLNTNSFHEDLTGVFISDLVLQILAYVAETERAFIKQRQAEGIIAAKNRGVKFGCRKSEVPEEFEKYYQMWIEGRISIRKAAQELGMNYTTFYRRCMEIKGKDENYCCKL
jgi:DNA invertase Pin-like site-specific DNA recombinase